MKTVSIMSIIVFFLLVAGCARLGPYQEPDSGETATMVFINNKKPWNRYLHAYVYIFKDSEQCSGISSLTAGRDSTPEFFAKKVVKVRANEELAIDFGLVEPTGGYSTGYANISTQKVCGVNFSFRPVAGQTYRALWEETSDGKRCFVTLHRVDPVDINQVFERVNFRRRISIAAGQGFAPEAKHCQP